MTRSGSLDILWLAIAFCVPATIAAEQPVSLTALAGSYISSSDGGCTLTLRRDRTSLMACTGHSSVSGEARSFASGFAIPVGERKEYVAPRVTPGRSTAEPQWPPSLRDPPCHSSPRSPCTQTPSGWYRCGGARVSISFAAGTSSGSVEKFVTARSPVRSPQAYTFFAAVITRSEPAVAHRSSATTPSRGAWTGPPNDALQLTTHG
jgi:hypothetical protein